MERVFLDANVLFSAAWRSDSGLARLWKLRGVKLLSSAFALAEARANLEEAAQHRRLEALAHRLELVPEPPEPAPLPRGVTLPEKDRPILTAAIGGRAGVLLTGDARHFGAYYGKTIEGVRVMPPGEYLRDK